MAKEDILKLFKTEEYGKAIIAIKTELRKDPDDGELIYLLFLAKNGDYSNIDLNNIVNEVDFNKALEISNRRLRNEFEAEYNFYRDSDPVFRKMFCYASRGNKNKVLELYEKVNTATMPTNLTEYIGNMDYVVTSKIAKDALELNLLTTNLLYICTKEEKIIPVLKQLASVMKVIDKRYIEYIPFKSKKGLKEYIFNNTSKEEDVELIEMPNEEEDIELVEIIDEEEIDNKSDDDKAEMDLACYRLSIIGLVLAILIPLVGPLVCLSAYRKAKKAGVNKAATMALVGLFVSLVICIAGIIVLIIVLSLSSFSKQLWKAPTPKDWKEPTVPAYIASAYDGGSVVNIRVWNDEFVSRFKDYYPGAVEKKAGEEFEITDPTDATKKLKVVFQTTAKQNNAYQIALDEALDKQATAAADQKVDMFLLEADYALKYVNTNNTVAVTDIGLTDADTAQMYQYTKDIATSNGKLKAVSWQATPGLFAYRADIAKAVLGTDDPTEVQKALSDWTKFDETAKKMKDNGYCMLSGYADA